MLIVKNKKEKKEKKQKTGCRAVINKKKILFFFFFYLRMPRQLGHLKFCTLFTYLEREIKKKRNWK